MVIYGTCKHWRLETIDNQGKTQNLIFEDFDAAMEAWTLEKEHARYWGLYAVQRKGHDVTIIEQKP